MSDADPRPPKWALARRLEYIDFRLFWDGRFNRSELAEKFGMSTQQASSDIADYERLAAGNLTYEPAARAFLRTDTFVPAFIGNQTDRYLLQLVAIHNGWLEQDDTWFATLPPVELLALRRPKANPTHLLAILDAIRTGQAVDIDYRSMTGSPESWRRIAPHAIAHTGDRWYVRAWAASHNDFRDYLLSRIRNVGASLSPVEPPVDYGLDYQWHQRFDIKLMANPALSEESRKAKEEELEMVDGVLVFPVRLSLSFYLIAQHNLDIRSSDLPPERQQLVLVNYDDVVSASRSAREMSIQALKRTRPS